MWPVATFVYISKDSHIALQHAMSEDVSRDKVTDMLASQIPEKKKSSSSNKNRSLPQLALADEQRVCVPSLSLTEISFRARESRTNHTRDSSERREKNVIRNGHLVIADRKSPALTFDELGASSRGS